MPTYSGTNASEYLPPNTLVQLTFTEKNSWDYVGWFNSQFASLMTVAIQQMTANAGVIATTPSNAVAGDTAATIDAVVKPGRTAAETVNAINAALPSGVQLTAFTVKRRAVDLNPAGAGDYSSNSNASATERANTATAAAAAANSGSIFTQITDTLSSLGTTAKYVGIGALFLFVWLKGKE